MKKYLQLICTGFVVLLLCAGFALFPVFPVDAQPYIEKKYAGWNGVLQAWIFTRWNPGGSFIRWLNRCASEFEKAHDGIYLEFIPVSEDILSHMDSSGIRKPDLVFFSPGVITNHDMLTELPVRESLRREFRNYGSGKAIPVAMSGYIWAYNPSLIKSVPQTPAELTTPVFPEDIPAAVLISLLSGFLEDSSGDYKFPDSDIDLGLPVSTDTGLLFSEDAIDSFIKGEIPCVPVDANTLTRLERLRENGRGPAWNSASSGELTCTDQVLLAAIPYQEEAHERIMLAEEFISLLLTESAQDALADIGAFSVTGKRIHSDFSVFSKMDAMLNHLPLWLSPCFSEYSVPNSEVIVRRFLKEEISAKNALGLLGFEEV